MSLHLFSLQSGCLCQGADGCRGDCEFEAQWWWLWWWQGCNTMAFCCRGCVQPDSCNASQTTTCHVRVPAVARVAFPPAAQPVRSLRGHQLTCEFFWGRFVWVVCWGGSGVNVGCNARRRHFLHSKPLVGLLQLVYNTADHSSQGFGHRE